MTEAEAATATRLLAEWDDLPPNSDPLARVERRRDEDALDHRIRYGEHLLARARRILAIVDEPP